MCRKWFAGEQSRSVSSSADDVNYNNINGPGFTSWTSGSGTLSYFSGSGGGGYTDAAATFYLPFGVIESATLGFVATGQAGTIVGAASYPTGSTSVPGTNPSIIVGLEPSAVTQFPVADTKSLATIDAAERQLGEIGSGPTIATVPVNTAPTPETIALTSGQVAQLQGDANSYGDPYTVTFRLADDGLQSAYSSPGGGFMSDNEQVRDVQLIAVYADPPIVAVRPDLYATNTGPVVIGQALASPGSDPLRVSLEGDRTFASGSTLTLSDGNIVYQPGAITSANGGTDILLYNVQDLATGGDTLEQENISLLPDVPPGRPGTRAAG